MTTLNDKRDKNQGQQYDGGAATETTAAMGASTSVPNPVIQAEPPVATATTTSNDVHVNDDNDGSIKHHDNMHDFELQLCAPVSDMKDARKSGDEPSAVPQVLKPVSASTIEPSQYSSLTIDGLPYLRSSSKGAKCRCLKYRPRAFIGAYWSGKTHAQTRDPEGGTYRCPGTITLNRETNEGTIIIAHECLAFESVAKSAAGGVTGTVSSKAVVSSTTSNYVNDVNLNNFGKFSATDSNNKFGASASVSEVDNDACASMGSSSFAPLSKPWEPRFSSGAKGSESSPASLLPEHQTGTKYWRNQDSQNQPFDGRGIAAAVAAAREASTSTTTSNDIGGSSIKQHDRSQHGFKLQMCAFVSDMTDAHESGDDSSAGPGSTNDTAIGQQVLESNDNASKSYMIIQGVPHQISNRKGIERRCRCLRHLPHGISVTSQYAKWVSSYGHAKSVNPDGKPHRCPGVVIVNQKTNERKVVVPHECPAPELTAESVASGVEGLTSTSLAPAHDDEYRVGASSAASQDADNGGINYCGSTKFFDTSLNVSDDTRIDRFEGYVLKVAHECGHSFVVGSSLASGNDGRCMAPNTSVDHHQAEPVNSASNATSHRGDIVRKMNERASIAKSSARTKLREVQPQARHQYAGPMDRTLVRHGMKTEVPSLELASDNEDVSSVASDKSYYKGLCVRLTERANTSRDKKKKYKNDNKALKEEIERLKKKNTDVNTQLSNTTDYKLEIKRLRKENTDLQEEILKRRSDNNEYKLKNKRLKQYSKDLNEELAEVKKQLSDISDNNNYNHRRMDHYTSSSFSAKYA